MLMYFVRIQQIFTSSEHLNDCIVCGNIVYFEK